ncbi:MAG: DUF3419 family protein [Pyrinomonadaceae bacterium]
MNSEQNVSEAVRTDGITSKQGFLQKLFAVWFDAFVYNQIWEDPRVDLQALRLNENSRVLTISSGGCNALNYLVENPESITAVDLNGYHIYLLRLKLAALQFLPTYEEFFSFFGFGKHAANVANYEKYIAPNLNAECQAILGKQRFFWKSAARQPHQLFCQRRTLRAFAQRLFPPFLSRIFTPFGLAAR